MDTIRKGDSGAAVLDIQGKLAALGLLGEDACTGVFDEATAQAIRAFRHGRGIPDADEVDEKTWSALLDASFQLGDRTLYLRMPFFHGNDVAQLQQALGSLGFDCGYADGIFGAHTEAAVRKFQMNLGLVNDGIVGSATFAALKNLKFSWAGKSPARGSLYLGFSRAADVLENHTLCLFGTEEFTRSVASRMSNLALATNPHSKIMSADSLLVAPGDDMLLVHIVLPGAASAGIPVVQYGDGEGLALRLRSAIEAAGASAPRIAIELPGTQWAAAGEGRSAQHFAITLLDALCVSLLP
ncbi:MAG: peptidoglycan-binding protein [Coriobacteriia bacterium]|nr:peptidoglycan-binding protein [Coriobacteriia bacterium]